MHREYRIHPGIGIARLGNSPFYANPIRTGQLVVEHPFYDYALGRYLIDYCGMKIEQMRFDEAGRVSDYGMPAAELEDIIQAGVAFRTSGCPGKFQDDISACDRPYGDSPPSDIASYPFQPNKKDIKKIRKQLDIPVNVE